MIMLTVAYYTGWSYESLMEMPLQELLDWYESVRKLHTPKKDSSNPSRREAY